MTYARASSRAEDYKEAADAYELFLEIAPPSDTERRDRIQGLIRFYRRLSGLQVHQVSGPALSEVGFRLGTDDTAQRSDLHQGRCADPPALVRLLSSPRRNGADVAHDV